MTDTTTSSPEVPDEAQPVTEATTLAGGNVGERIFAASPARAVRIVGGAIAGFSVLLSFAVFLPSVWMFVPAAWVGLFFLQVGIAPLYTALSAISPPRLRPLMLSLLGLMVAVMGDPLAAFL